MINVPYEDMPREIEALLGEIEQLEQENQQLKDRNKLLEKHYTQLEKDYGEELGRNIVYKFVLDEIREYINGFDFEHLHEVCEHNLVEVLEMILQILGKVSKE